MFKISCTRNCKQFKHAAGIVIPLVCNFVMYVHMRLLYAFHQLWICVRGIIKQRRQYAHFIWLNIQINISAISGMCDCVPQQSEGEDNNFLDHFILPDRQLGTRLTMLMSALPLWVLVCAYVLLHFLHVLYSHKHICTCTLIFTNMFQKCLVLHKAINVKQVFLLFFHDLLIAAVII